MPKARPTPLESLARAWRAAVRRPRRRLVTALFAFAVVVGLLVAREGTARSRGGPAMAVGVLAVAVLLHRRHERALFRDPALTVALLAGRVDPPRAQRALRALSLVDRKGKPKDPDTSAALARLHVARAVDALPAARIRGGAAQLGSRFALLALSVAAATLGLTMAAGFRLVEGADVLLARGGVAPLPLQWLQGLEVRARPPEYLHSEEASLAPFNEAALPRGTLLTVKGTPLRPGRRLALTDGTTEIPFVEDGTGQVVARWPLGGSVALRVVARFGHVLVQEPSVTTITSIADEVPVVHLEEAPKQVLLASEEAADLPLRYDATDDHGLREVHLVLRSGVREERRVLSRLDGETRTDRGGYVLRARDAFVRKSHVPIEVRVEAKDNDPITGPKWGASAAITLVPPDVGEPEARRYDALVRVRDAFVDSLAWSLTHDVPKAVADRAAYVAAEQKGELACGELLEAALAAGYAGLRVPGRIQAILQGRARKIHEAMEAEARGPTAATHVALVKATERMVLVVDGVLRSVGTKDSKEAARQLADVADDLALGAAQGARAIPATGGASVTASSSAPNADRGVARMDAATTVLQGGSRSLLRLGALGRDLGEIIVADLGRVNRGRKDGDLSHAELAARDLAARLHVADPSFGSRGRSSRGGGEAGGGRGASGDEEGGEGDAEQAFDEASSELEKLSSDHALGIGKVEEALSGAGSDEDLKQLSADAKKHAQSARDAVQGLPTYGAGEGSWTSKGSAAREHGEAFARALEQGRPADAVTSGRHALNALEEARRLAGRERWMAFGGAESEAEKRLRDATQKLEPEVRWAEQSLEALRKKAAERAAGELGQRGDEEESMADRARELTGRGRDQGSMPAPALESLEGAEKSAREAARALKRGEADRALEQQRDAQRLLEMAREALGSSQEGERGGDDGSHVDNGRTDIPKADDHKGPEDFRRRVVKGLGQASGGRLKDAVRRYAEGLLR